MSPTWRRANSRCAKRSSSPSACRASRSRTCGRASAPAGSSATSPMSRSSSAATRSSSRTSTSCCAAARTRSTAAAQVVLHAHPALYTLDGARGRASSRSGSTPTGSASTSTSSPPTRRRCATSTTCIRSAHLGVKAIVASPVAAGAACLTEEERDLGVALVELGAEVTNVSLHAGGMLVGLRSIPLGARDITDDIACAFGIQRARRRAAEMLLRLGDDQPARQSRDDRGRADRRRGRAPSRRASPAPS